MPRSTYQKPDGIVDMDTFSQLLEMDDEDDHDFSKSLAFNYIDQARTTLKEMEAAAQTGHLTVLSQKGHFLKGSSAALGLIRVKETCEKMQHTGLKKLDGRDITDNQALQICKELLKQLKAQNGEAEQWLRSFYD